MKISVSFPRGFRQRKQESKKWEGLEQATAERLRKLLDKKQWPEMPGSMSPAKEARPSSSSSWRKQDFLVEVVGFEESIGEKERERFELQRNEDGEGFKESVASDYKLRKLDVNLHPCPSSCSHQSFSIF